MLSALGCGGGADGAAASGGGDSTGAATLSWDAPVTNEDGSELSDLGGYRIYYGGSPGSYYGSRDVGCASCLCRTEPGTACEYELNGLNLGAGTYYFAVTAYDTSGNESELSEPVSAVIN